MDSRNVSLVVVRAALMFAVVGLLAARPAWSQDFGSAGVGSSFGTQRIQDSGLTLELAPFAVVPRTVSGRAPRLNDLTTATIGNVDFLFVADEGVKFSTTDRRNQGVPEPRLVQSTDQGFETGRIYSINSQNGFTDLFLNVGQAVFNATGRHVDNSNPETGLRAVAFHPDFATNGKFYTSHSELLPGTSRLVGGNYIGPTDLGPIAIPQGGTNNGNPTTGPFVLSIETSGVETDHFADGVLAEWSYNHVSNTVSSSYREVFRTAYRIDVAANIAHPIQDISFNPYANPGDEDYGLLYISHGDNLRPGGTGQNGADARGKYLRIDPLAQQNGDSYGIPDTNPFLAATGDPAGAIIDEAYAIGVRNPHKFNFARTPGGEVVILDSQIGENSVEELNLIVAGGNYGWNDREGTFDFNEAAAAGGDVFVGTSTLPSGVDDGYIYPVAQYGRQGGGLRAIAGAVALNFDDGDASNGDFANQVIFGNISDSKLFIADYEDILNAVTSGVTDNLTQAEIFNLDVELDHDNNPATPALTGSLASLFGESLPTLTGENHDGSGRGDANFFVGHDGTVFLLNKHNGVVYRVTSGLAAVPEPRGFVLIISVALGWLVRRGPLKRS